MTRRNRITTRLLGVLLVSIALAGCLGEPEIDDRWTKVEMLEMSPQPAQALPGDQPIAVNIKGRITYRRILTGFLVAEVRYSDTIGPATVALDPAEHTLECSKDVDRILANSVTAGRATRAVTGFDHLMQDIDLNFTAQVPQELFAANDRGLYLLLYMGDGDEIQLQNGRDSLVVTPFVSENVEVLHTGFALDVTPPGSTP
jgi:hypothetical protein